MDLFAGSRGKGIILTMLSAFFFGASPLLVPFTYELGGNPETVNFFRSFFAALILLVILVVRKVPLSLGLRTIKDIALVGVFGGGLTTLLLYNSYSYIGIGTATTLHFVYPVFVCLICRIFFKEQLGIRRIVVLLIASIGIVCFFEPEQVQGGTGLVLAVVSGITYALYMVGMEKRGLDQLNSYLVTFYIGIFVALFLLLYSLPSGAIRVDLPMQAYVYMFVLAVATSFLGVMLLQMGIKYLGATTASIFCLFEPITSIISGGIFLDETLTWLKALGCGLIFLSVILLAMEKEKTPKSAK
jgi:Predicted permease, DMT superfamily